ncbi:anti-sigma factor [Algoriphagus halophytocola]|uniref:Anti-sigma factor n=1 Tax=Algoriphagus halophytocola TaxID=2991499 RepID=A0ABY6MEN7_9BACT|nr:MULTISPECIES: anti-sigma factor [unclassified Algoriphagus]UZD22268.1 anti-sigma factor [Algoriphagus sp. TR-M5]WBL43516.1 anti-sigma factor [Algoriphagus sp. TR-M9]
MDIQSYIASGKLELFLLGELTERERAEVVALAKTYPEIQSELDALEETMFAFDNMSGPAPSDEVKNKIFSTLESDFILKEAPKPTAVPADEKVIPISSPWKPFAIAASIAAIVASGAAFYYADKYQERDQQFEALLQDQNAMADNLNQVKQQFEEKDSQLDKLIAGDFKRVEMRGEGFEMQKDAKVDVFWDQNAQEVFVAVNTLNDLSEEFDYQLWAIGDDGPIGIGLVNSGEKLTLQQMQAVAQAGAFAITIEPKGGSEAPTLEKLVVLGEVA